MNRVVKDWEEKKRESRVVRKREGLCTPYIQLGLIHIITWDNMEIDLKSFQSLETSPMHANVEEPTGPQSTLDHQGSQCRDCYGSVSRKRVSRQGGICS